MASEPYPLFSTRKRPHGRRNELTLPQEPSISDLNVIFPRRRSVGRRDSGETTLDNSTSKLHDSGSTAPLSLYDSAQSSSAFSYHDSAQTTSSHGSFHASSCSASALSLMHGSSRAPFSSQHDSGMTSLQSFETARTSLQDEGNMMCGSCSIQDGSHLSPSSFQDSSLNAPGTTQLSRMGSQNEFSDESVDGRETKRAHLLRTESEPTIDPSKQEVPLLRRKQLRLLLLRHATLCEISPGEECPVTRRCSDAKVLCNHIMICADPSCDYPRCLTSREVIGHHRECTDISCQICLPLRQNMMKTPEFDMEVVHDQSGER